jgi:hypothetical protein
LPAHEHLFHVAAQRAGANVPLARHLLAICWQTWIVEKCSAFHHAITKTGQRSVERYFRAKFYDRVLSTVSIINATRI